MSNSSILPENKAISEQFVDLVSNMFGVIDEVSEEIGDGKYLELANQFKKLMDFKDKMKTNIVYIEHERRTRMATRRINRPLTMAQKLADPKKYYKCKKCDCVITKKEKYSHENRRKCKNIYMSRMITLATKMKVSNAGMICIDEMLDTRTGFYYKGEIKGRPIYTIKIYYEIQIEKENECATKIQALYRGYCVRKNV